MEREIIHKSEEKIKEILDNDINPTNLPNLYQLVKIRHMAKEDEDMRYSNYGRDAYGRRGYDTRYRGHDYIERMSYNYGRYEESRNEYNRGGSYGAKEDSMKELEYMLQSVCDFLEMLERDASSQDERALIKKYTRKLSEM